MKHTHGMITSKFLRHTMALELWQARKARGVGVEYWHGLRFGIESGFWAMQKVMMRDILK